MHKMHDFLHGGSHVSELISLTCNVIQSFKVAISGTISWYEAPLRNLYNPKTNGLRASNSNAMHWKWTANDPDVRVILPQDKP